MATCKICGYALTIDNERHEQYAAEVRKNEINTPKCPTCGSTKIRPISSSKRAASILGLGILSKNIGKTFECLNCKYKW